jgi:hypothetical protein
MRYLLIKNIMNKLILEEIQRMNLLSKYDNLKTLSEQANPALDVAKEIHKSVSGPGTNEDVFKNAIMRINNANEFDMDAANLETVKAISDHLKSKGVNNTYETNSDKYDSNKKYFKPNTFKILTTTADATTDPWTKYPCVVNHPNAKKTKDSSGGVVYLINGVYYYGNGRKMLADRTMANYTCNDAEFKSGASGSGTKTPAKPVATPPELKDIKSFQDWLDVNAKGWATGYKDGIINKGQNGAGYGKFGPRTQKAWTTYKDQFLKGGTTATQTPPPEIEGEDNTQTIDPNDSEFGGGATTAQPAAQPAAQL